MNYLKLTVLLMIVFTIQLSGQDSMSWDGQIHQDSFNRLELYLISTLLTELKYKREGVKLLSEEVRLNDDIISDYERKELEWNRLKTLQEQRIESLVKPFYDTFYFGFISGLIVSTIIFILVK